METGLPSGWALLTIPTLLQEGTSGPAHQPHVQSPQGLRPDRKGGGCESPDHLGGGPSLPRAPPVSRFPFYHCRVAAPLLTGMLLRQAH